MAGRQEKGLSPRKFSSVGVCPSLREEVRGLWAAIFGVDRRMKLKWRRGVLAGEQRYGGRLCCHRDVSVVESANNRDRDQRTRRIDRSYLRYRCIALQALMWPRDVIVLVYEITQQVLQMLLAQYDDVVKNLAA